MPLGNSAESNQPKQPKALRARRVTLLASVAAIAAVALLAGPGGYRPTGLNFGTPAAQAAEPTLQHPASFADIVEKVKPAVISVRVKFTAAAEPATLQNGKDETLPFAPGSPLEKFFQQFGNQDGQNDRGTPPQTQRVITGEGSGFFISADGYAVTNYHVVEHAKSVQVTTDDGTIYTAKVVGVDPKTDLALIKVEGKKDFPFVKFAAQAPHVGDWVVAVGNPFGLGGTVTAGIVSARGRDIGAGPYDDYIQIDAPINKGNSGGPAFDVNGDVIGINTAIYSPSGGSVGIGFDIPAETAKLVITQLREKGSVTRGWLGVQIQPVTPAIADSLGLDKVEGVIVDEAQADSPAAKAGIEPEDVIVAVNGTPVKDPRELARMIAMIAPQAAIKLDIIRKGHPQTVSVTLSEMPNEHQANADSNGATVTSGVPHLGLRVAPASTVSGVGVKGVVVVAVDPNSAAAEEGFRTGTVILAINGTPVSNADDVRRALREAQAQGKHEILLRVKQGDATRFVALPLGNA